MKENRGGARPGAGRPRKRKDYTDRTKKELVAALKKKASESGGKGPWDILAELLHSARTSGQVKVNLLRLVADILVVKESVSEEHKYDWGPGVMLPPVQPKPQEAIEREKQFMDRGFLPGKN